MNGKASFSLPFRLQRGTDRVKKASCEIKVVLLAAPSATRHLWGAATARGDSGELLSDQKSPREPRH